MNHPKFDFNLKIVIKVATFSTLSRVGIQNPLIVWVFEHSELKFTNV